MTATYTNDPLNRPVDTVRHEINDKSEPFQLTDEEIQYAIDTNVHILLAAATCAEQIAATYAPEPKSKSVGDLAINYGGEGRYATYTDLAESLRKRARRKAGSSIYAGGISQSDTDTILSDTDRRRIGLVPGRDDFGAGLETGTDGVYR